MDDVEEVRMVLNVTNMKPPFLGANVKFTRQNDMVLLVKDTTSDFAKAARAGSRILKQMMEEVRVRPVVHPRISRRSRSIETATGMWLARTLGSFSTFAK